MRHASIKKAQPQVQATQEKEIERNLALLPAPMQRELAQVEVEKAAATEAKRSVKA